MIDYREIVKRAMRESEEYFRRVEEIAVTNLEKVLAAFQKYEVAYRHFAPTTGYGYDDVGRDTLDKIYAEVLGAEQAIVSPNWVSGTHVLSDALFSQLHPGDKILSAAGKPYDTLEEVIGIAGNAFHSLKNWGIEYNQVDLNDKGEIDYEALGRALQAEPIQMVLLQRSPGYSFRSALSIEEIEKFCQFVKKSSPDTLIFVDNCYGEFTDIKEPTEVGVDLMAGSLIKNIGGGIAPTGGYAAGTGVCIERLAQRLTAPSIGREVGSYAYGYQSFYQGLFMAPTAVSNAVKGAILFAKGFELLGFEVRPASWEPRNDIIQAICLEDEALMIEICRIVQSVSPLDSNVVPLPWDMPGYTSQVIMAAGTFVQGASIELSCDGPVKPPYVLYMQGGITFEHVVAAFQKVIEHVVKSGKYTYQSGGEQK